MVIDNVGYNVEEMVKLPEAEFIKLHLSNPAIAPDLPDKERKAYLKQVYAELKKVGK